VMLRGNVGEDIFFFNEDQYHLYMLLQEKKKLMGLIDGRD